MSRNFLLNNGLRCFYAFVDLSLGEIVFLNGLNLFTICFLSGELYNLKADLGEKNNVAGTNPEVVKRLRIMLEDFVVDIEANSRPVGIASNSRTLVPRPDIEGEEGYRPTLSLQGKKK